MDEDDHEYWIYRLMIDQKYQGLGYGTKTLDKILEIIKLDKQHHKIFLGGYKESIALFYYIKRLDVNLTVKFLGNNRLGCCIIDT